MRKIFGAIALVMSILALGASQQVNAAAGEAYVFLNPTKPINLGHTGWGFKLANGNYMYGSTENSKSYPVIRKGDDNGYWEREGTRDDMLGAFRGMKYTHYKVATVANANPTAARSKARFTKGNGYGVTGNNCMDHVYWILQAYNVPNLPWPSTHWAPNSWANDFKGKGYYKT